MSILIIIKVNILMLMKWSYKFPPIMLPIELKKVIIFWAHNPISIEHVSFGARS